MPVVVEAVDPANTQSSGRRLGVVRFLVLVQPYTLREVSLRDTVLRLILEVLWIQVRGYDTVLALAPDNCCAPLLIYWSIK